MVKPNVLLLLGGDNTRFAPFNQRTHKAGITLCGQPIIFRTLERLQNAGYTRVVVVYNPKDATAEGLKKTLPAAFPQLNLQMVVQPQARGMGDAVLHAREYLDEQFIVSSGYDDRLAQVADQILALNEPIVITASHTDRPWEYGMLQLENDRAVGIVEKPTPGEEPSSQKIQSTYLLNQDFLSQLAQLPPAEYNFETALNQRMQQESVAVFTEELLTLKYPWHLFDFQTHYFSQLHSYQAKTAQIAETAFIDETQGPVYIEEGVTIGHAAHIMGPAYIGKDVLVGSFAFIRGSSIEKGCVIGSYTEIARSIIMANTNIHFAYVGDSIFGEEINVGAGLITANKRLDREIVPVTVKGTRVSTNRSGLGCLIGDQAQIGIRVSIMPGVMIGHGATVFPGQVLYQNVEAQTISKPSTV